MYLNAHTYFSFRYGTLSVKELLQLAQKSGVKTLALTDINNTSACLSFIRLAPSYGIRPVVGIDFRNGVQQQFIGLAKNNEGFLALNNLLSHHLHTEEKIPPQTPSIEEVVFIYPFSKRKEIQLKENEFFGVTIPELQQLRFSPWRNKTDQLVALRTVSLAHQKDFSTHSVLRAIGENTLVTKLSPEDLGNINDVMLSVSKLSEAYAAFPQLLSNAAAVLNACHIHFEFGTEIEPKNQTCYLNSEEEDFELVKQLCEKGLHYRYPKITEALTQRLDKELMVIREKIFLSYFLISWRIIEYARSQNYFYVGRGSGANSIIAYLLRITDVDPIELDLYFERFINLYRKNPPDFDIDFSWRDREDVTRFIFNEFENTSLLATYSTFKGKSAIREVSKTFGLPKYEIDQLIKTLDSLHQLDPIKKSVLKYADKIQGFPNHLSVHAGGILISEKPIHYYSATSLPPKGFPTTHFSMEEAEDVGLYKFDILGQRGLGKIKEALQIVKKNNPNDPDIDIHNMYRFKHDKKINTMLSRAEAIGCFYVESPAMRMLLKKLEVNTYLGLVAASSVIRPGVAQSGMMQEYILRHRNPERIKNAHPILLNLMPETYGVMVYQEDVIKVAHYFAGLTLGEADVLRRGMSGKYRSREEFQIVREKFFLTCKEKGHDPKSTADIWRQIESFAGYAFAKGHSASYAVESYQSLFLKAYYPLEYMVAVINNGGGFYSTEFYVHEARMLGAQIQLPCVNKSQIATCIVGKTIHLGLGLIQELNANSCTCILEARVRNGTFTSLDNFIERVSISIEQIKILIRINAFAFTGKSKKSLFWDAHLLCGFKRSDWQIELFANKPKKHKLPPLYQHSHEDAFTEMNLLGFSLCSPFHLINKIPSNTILAKGFHKYINQTVRCIGYLVTIKNTQTSKGDRMYFGTFLDQNGDYIDTVHFPPVAARYPFRGRGCYLLRGKVMEEFEFLSVEVTAMYKLNYINLEKEIERDELQLNVLLE